MLEMEGEEQEQDNEAETGHNVSEEPVDEVYTQHQEAYPGVQGVISVIHQRVSDPSASYFLAKWPAYGRKSILEIATQFGIPDLPLELKFWFLKNQGIEGSAVQTALNTFNCLRSGDQSQSELKSDSLFH